MMKVKFFGGTTEEIVREIDDWPDDFTQWEIERATLDALGGYYDVVGGKLVARPNPGGIVPHEVRVFNSAGEEIHRCNIYNLAQSLGVQSL